MAGQGWVPGQVQGAWGVHGWNQGGRASNSGAQGWAGWGSHSQYGQAGYNSHGVQQWGQRGGWGGWQAHSQGAAQGGAWQGVVHGQEGHSQGRAGGWVGGGGGGATCHHFGQATSTQGLKAGQGTRVNCFSFLQKRYIQSLKTSSLFKNLQLLFHIKCWKCSKILQLQKNLAHLKTSNE